MSTNSQLLVDKLLTSCKWENSNLEVSLHYVSPPRPGGYVIMSGRCF